MSDEHLASQGENPHASGAGQDPVSEAEAQAATATEPAGNLPGEQEEEEAASNQTPAESGVQRPVETGDGEPAGDTPSRARPDPAQAPPHEPGGREEPAEKEHEQDAAEFEAALEASEGTPTGTAYDSMFRPLVRGQLVTARVIQVDKDKAFVDLGTKSEGVVPLEELSTSAVESAADVVSVGDEIKVVVLNPEGREGNPICSKKRADFESAWDRIVHDFESKRPITALVTERVKGGLVVDIGVRGFVPATHVGSGRVRNLDKLVGQSLPFVIIEVDRERRKVVLSNRFAEEELREERKKKIFESVKPGDIIDGVVRRVVDYGAFVDLGGVDGLLHVSEMSWSRVEHPKEVVKDGDEVRVMVLRLDPSHGRISLGRRQVLPDPWTTIRDSYTLGQRLSLPISRVVQSGAFVKLPEGAEAFIPVSEMSHRRITKPFEVVNPGQTVDVQVVDLRPDERRMVLSMRALLPYEEAPHRREDRRRRERRGRERGEAPRGHQAAAAASGTTIGERLSALRGLAALGESDQAETDVEQAEASAQPPEVQPEEAKVQAQETVEESEPAGVEPTEE